MPGLSLLEKYLYILTYGKNMNVNPCFMRFFPLLIGGYKSRMNFCASFVENFSATTNSASYSNSSSFSQNALKENPYYRKYAEKIEKLNKSDPQEYQKRLKLLDIQHSSSGHDDSLPLNDNESAEKNFKYKQSTTTTTATNDNTKDKTLDSILNVEKIQNLSTEEIRYLWVEYYADKDAVCAVIPSSTYRNVYSLASAYPVFVYPIPRKDGYEMFVGQFALNDFHFTSLFNYQRHQSNAPNQLTLNHYIDLEDTKDIVLMSGLIHDLSLTVTDAQLLSYLVQHFYLEYPSLVKKFNTFPSAFNFEDAINALDKNLLMKAAK